MNYSNKRYWEPTTFQAITSSVSVGVLATALWQPLDLVKTRIQQRAEGIGIRQVGPYAGYNPNKIFREVHSQGLGMRGFYAGLDAALLARGSYLFTRNLVYKVIYDRVKPVKPSNDLTPREKAVLSAFAGSIGAIVSNPFEVVLIRQQCDGALAPERKRGYASFFDAYSKIAAGPQGGLGLMRGVVPSILRAIVLNASISFPYNHSNEWMFNHFGDNYANRPIALAIGALVGATLSLPFDNLKTRLQYAFSDAAKNRLNYAGTIDCARQVFIHEAWTGFYAGYYVYIVRTFLYGLTTIYAMDFVTNRWKRQAGLKPKFI